MQGEATASPQPPKLLRNNNYYDISLAQLYIPANALQVETVTDERYDAELCGICQGLYTLDMSDFEDLNQIPRPPLPSTSRRGHPRDEEGKRGVEWKGGEERPSMRTFVRLEQIGLTTGSETIADIAEELNERTKLILRVDDRNASIYPNQYGFLRLLKLISYE